MANEADLKSQIEVLQAQLDKKQEELKKVSAQTEAERLAEFLHEKIHRNYSEDSWFYESWDQPGHTRQEWHARAKRLLNRGYRFRDVADVLKIVTGETV